MCERLRVKKELVTGMAEWHVSEQGEVVTRNGRKCQRETILHRD